MIIIIIIQALNNLNQPNIIETNKRNLQLSRSHDHLCPILILIADIPSCVLEDLVDGRSSLDAFVQPLCLIKSMMYSPQKNKIETIFLLLFGD